MKNGIGHLMVIGIFVFSAGLYCTYPDVGARRERGFRTDRAIRVFTGKATYYGPKFHGRKTANGETFNQHALTAAHKTWPFGTLCRVTNRSNHKQVTVRINDRGPFVPGRILDLSYGAAKAIDGVLDGVMDVKIEILKWGESSK